VFSPLCRCIKPELFRPPRGVAAFSSGSLSGICVLATAPSDFLLPHPRLPSALDGCCPFSSICHGHTNSRSERFAWLSFLIQAWASVTSMVFLPLLLAFQETEPISSDCGVVILEPISFFPPGRPWPSASVAFGFTEPSIPVHPVDRSLSFHQLSSPRSAAVFPPPKFSRPADSVLFYRAILVDAMSGYAALRFPRR